MKRSTFDREQSALAQLLRDIRTTAQITQEQLAANLNWRQTDISKVERCVRQIGHVELRHWVKALGIDMIALEMEYQARLERLGVASPAHPKRRTVRKLD